MATHSKRGTVLFGAIFVFAGIAHFVVTPLYVRAVPAYLPYPREIVLLSGAISVLLGIGLCVEAVRRWAAWGIMAYLAAVFPANVHMALHPELFPNFPVWLTWARLPLQGALIYWAARYTR